jgi:hypothetical protein
MQIFIKRIDGSTITIETLNTETISQIKSKVESITGIKPQYQRLIYDNKLLEGEKTLDGYGICSDTTIHLINLTPSIHKMPEAVTSQNPNNVAQEKSLKLPCLVSVAALSISIATGVQLFA